MFAADRGPAAGAGAPAAVPAGDGEARRPRLHLRPGRLHQQDPGGGAGARGQEAKAGTEKKYIFLLETSIASDIYNWRCFVFFFPPHIRFPTHNPSCMSKDEFKLE